MDTIMDHLPHFPPKTLKCLNACHILLDVIRQGVQVGEGVAWCGHGKVSWLISHIQRGGGLL